MGRAPILQQMEYAALARDGDGVLEYAQKFRSSPSQRWAAAEGEEQSPLGPPFAGELPKGAYHGYRYHILTAQGEHAPQGDSIAKGMKGFDPDTRWSPVAAELTSL